MSLRAALLFCVTTATSTTACKDRDPSVEVPAPSTPPAPRAAPQATPPPDARPPAPLKEWQDSPVYRFRLVDARPCALPDEAAARSKRPPGDRLRVIAEVEATTEQLWLTPRAFALEKNGAVLQGQLKPAPSAGCEDLLEPQRLLPGESVRASVVFDVPNQSYARSAVLSFRPPRWRLAPRVTVQLPDCFDCESPTKITILAPGKD